jgi:hypothetical protein
MRKAQCPPVGAPPDFLDSRNSGRGEMAEEVVWAQRSTEREPQYQGLVRCLSRKRTAVFAVFAVFA